MQDSVYQDLVTGFAGLDHVVIGIADKGFRLGFLDILRVFLYLYYLDIPIAGFVNKGFERSFPTTYLVLALVGFCEFGTRLRNVGYVLTAHAVEGCIDYHRFDFGYLLDYTGN
nr:hypothetical protein [Methanohalobium evestigatum]